MPLEGFEGVCNSLRANAMCTPRGLKVLMGFHSMLFSRQQLGAWQFNIVLRGARELGSSKGVLNNQRWIFETPEGTLCSNLLPT